MELRIFAERILDSPSIDAKLEPLEVPVEDNSPGEPRRVETPARPSKLLFAAPRTAPSMPHPLALADEGKRAVAHHIMANHELQALEVMAWVMLAFPDAPSEFRIGLAHVMADEQRHTRMHMERASRLGLEFGDLPVNCYIWKQTRSFTVLLDYIATLPLVFEARNLDHTVELEDAFLAVNDPRSAALMRRIHEDEKEHVAFGMHWLRELKEPQQSEWEAYQSHLKWPMSAAKSYGTEFQREARLSSGMSAEFVDRIVALQSSGQAPSVPPRQETPHV
jgi:uncharacterized ferritin-like protein (DUF455 family)